MESYVRELQYLFAELTTCPMSEADKIFAFHRGLKLEIAMVVKVDPVPKQQWPSFVNAAHFAVRHDIALTFVRSRQLGATCFVKVLALV